MKWNFQRNLWLTYTQRIAWFGTEKLQGFLDMNNKQSWTIMRSWLTACWLCKLFKCCLKKIVKKFIGAKLFMDILRIMNL